MELNSKTSIVKDQLINLEVILMSELEVISFLIKFYHFIRNLLVNSIRNFQK